MKTDGFGQPQPGPGDDLTAAFEEVHGNSDRLEAFGEEISNEEHMGGFCVEVRNADGDGLTIRDFPTEEAIRAYLASFKVEIA